MTAPAAPAPRRLSTGVTAAYGFGAVAYGVKDAGFNTFLTLDIDGKPYKTLKRHLTKQGLTPDAYRERFGLPNAYPMVAETTHAMRRATALASDVQQVGRS